MVGEGGTPTLKLDAVLSFALLLRQYLSIPSPVSSPAALLVDGFLGAFAVPRCKMTSNRIDMAKQQKPAFLGTAAWRRAPPARARETRKQT